MVMHQNVVIGIRTAHPQTKHLVVDYKLYPANSDKKLLVFEMGSVTNSPLLQTVWLSWLIGLLVISHRYQRYT